MFQHLYIKNHNIVIMTYNPNDYIKYKDSMKASQKKYYTANRDKILAKQKEYEEKNKDKIRAYRKEYYQKRKARVALASEEEPATKDASTQTE